MAQQTIDRPKCDAFVGFKLPDELKQDALELAGQHGATEAEIWKETMEFRLMCERLGIKFDRSGVMAYWKLRTFQEPVEVQPGLTLRGKV
ncbi:MAG: hypothetical protein FJ245_15430 [Nitrospira sp.]|nr:hypothetical protein [Nitrospira sp.]